VSSNPRAAIVVTSEQALLRESVVSSGVEQGTSGDPSVVLAAKLRPAASPDRLVARARLFSVLDGATRTPVCLVVAPAGSGKTSLVASWIRAAGVRSAWLSLDETDRDPARMWRSVIVALDQVLPGAGAGSAALLDRPGDPVAAVDALLSELHAVDGSGPVVLVLDDAHHVADVPGVASSLALFLQHLPAWLHVVIASRVAPLIPVTRMRARGQLFEVSYEQLRFSPGEARELLVATAPGLAPKLVEQATVRADGWAASLRLSALAALSAPRRDRPVGAAPGADEQTLVEDYLWHDVFAGEDPEVLGVLLETSVVERINPGLGEQLTGRTDVATVLASAEERGLFVSRLGSTGWYQVHSLIRAALRTELDRRSPGRLAHQHERAAVWFETNGQVTLALEHWLRADRPRDALRLLAQSSAGLYDGGRERTTMRVIARIPPTTAATGLDALVEYAWCHILVDHQRFLDLVDRATQMLADTAKVPPELRGRVRMLESIAAMTRGDWADSAARSKEAVELLGRRAPTDLLGQFGWNMIARDIALSERWRESSAEVRQVRSALSLDLPRTTAFQGTQALGEALAGQPTAALRRIRTLRYSVDVDRRTILRMELAVAQAIAHRETGDREGAVRLLQPLVEEPVGPAAYARLLALAELTELRLDEGDLDAAGETFDRARLWVNDTTPGRGSADRLSRTGTLLEVRRGRPDDAATWAGRVDDTFWGPVSRTWVELARGEHAMAEKALTDAVPRCPRHQVVRRLLRYRLAPDAPGGPADLMAAAQTASSYGLVQTVADEGGVVLDGLNQMAWQMPGDWLQRVSRAAPVEPFGSVPNLLDQLPDPLTDRELQVLLLLPTSLTMHEIAARLSISRNTLKTHLKSVYRKLDCGSRQQAAEIVRTWGSDAAP
jgi:LuxR family transcriptional regulator, maltose regulon positive regulatory protein